MNKAIELLNKMEFQLTEAKVNQRAINQLRQHLEVWGEPIINDYHRILKDIEIYEYREVIEIWNLVTPDQWANYGRLDIRGLREQLLINKARINLKDVFNKRVISRGKKNETRQEAIAAITNGIAVQS